MTPNEVFGQAPVETAVAPTTPAPLEEVQTGVENQSTELAELQRQEAEHDRYLNGVGGAEKAQATIEEVRARVAAKAQLVAEHKESRTLNRDLNNVTEPVVQAPATTEPATVNPAPAYNQAMLDEINRNILRETATEFPGVADIVQNGELLKDAKAFGLAIVKDGLVDRQVLNRYAELIQAQRKAQNAGNPSSEPEVVSMFAGFEATPQGAMTKEKAANIILQSQGAEQHPEYQRAVNVMRTGIDS